ncbi:DUF7289 family protein [Halocatena pleomorpha]|uniref:Type IV pilin n=1 Tax=Halocatena pleomorpha TaxID=1785090 RepID=A0A3P3R726_9EURY|nr:type IV pilin [Halocatena pleomorpha]RRJ29184.1 type IV pilin [Halocatena pleomorpha]
MSGSDRGQSHVVGIALLVGVTVISIAAITASVGVLIDQQVASADAIRVADGMEAAFDPKGTSGVRRDRLPFADGTLRPVDRQLRLIDGTTVVRSIDTDALVFTSGDQRVTFAAGAIMRGSAGEAWLHAKPMITAPPNGSTLIVGAPVIGTPDTVSGSGTTVTIEQNVTHERSVIGNATDAVSIETTTPGPLSWYFSERGAAVERQDLDGDGVESIIVTFRGERQTYLIVHELNVEVI